MAVYESEEQAEAAARAAENLGVPENSIRVGDVRDAVPALEAEMRAEMEEGLIAPQAGVAVPKEQAKASGAAMALAAVVGAIVFLPFGAIAFAGLTLGSRLLICALAGAAAGMVGTYVVGRAAEYYYQQGRRPPPDLLEGFGSEAIEQVRHILPVLGQFTSRLPRR